MRPSSFLYQEWLIDLGLGEITAVFCVRGAASVGVLVLAWLGGGLCGVVGHLDISKKRGHVLPPAPLQRDRLSAHATGGCVPVSDTAMIARWVRRRNAFLSAAGRREAAAAEEVVAAAS